MITADPPRVSTTILAIALLLATRPQAVPATPDAPLTPDPIVFHVAPSGNDAWSGTLPSPNPDRDDGPFATIQKARDATRATRVQGKPMRPVSIVLHAGVYRQDTPLVFTAADSGTAESPVIYRAHPGERPVISGGAPIRGWRRETDASGDLWTAPVPDLAKGKRWRFNQLFIDGKRRPRARTPNAGGFLRSDGPISKGDSRGFHFKANDVRDWNDLREAIFVVYHSWETSIHHVRSIDLDARQVRFVEPAHWPMGQWERQQRYYIENVRAALDAPGEWYLDPQAGSLLYRPLPGEDLGKVQAVAPRVTSTLVHFDGDAAKGEFVAHIQFRGIAFQHSNANLSRIRNPGQGEIYQPALLMATGLRHARFEDCEIAHTGAHGIWLAAGCEDVAIRRCHIHDLGGGGVYIGGGWGVQEATATRRIIVDNNFITDGSHLFHGAHGVWIGTSSHNAVTHNEISNLDYSGISCGWSWGFQPSSANHNTLDFNHIHHLGNGDGLSDMGGIYTLGISPGTTERNNHIHDIFNYAHVSHGSGIYPDEGSSEILIENNAVYRVRTCPLFQHYGKDNIVRNNILALGGEAQLRRCREDKPCHYVAERNIVYADNDRMLGGIWKNNDWKLAHNLYWSTAGTPRFLDMDLAAWQARGNDAGSIVADPGFVDPQRGDFRLHPDSPALRIGFQPFDVRKAGLYGKPEWVDLPSRTANRPLNEIPAPVDPPFIVNFDFEADPAGSAPLEGEPIIDPGQSLAVSTDPSAGGRHCLKFVDAPGQKRAWTPHLYYRPSCVSGEYTLSWDMRNSKESPASFSLETRQWDAHPYLVGQSIAVAPDGKVSAGRQSIGTIPLGVWVHAEIRFQLGTGAPRKARVTLTIPDRDPISAEIPFASDKFERVTWFGISSSSAAPAVFYLDNLKLGTAEELARPPRRPPTPRPVKSAPRTPPNTEALAGHWTFEEGAGYTAKDGSGCGNDGDVWASWAKGTFGSAIFCDPTNSHVEIPDSPTLQFGTADFSIALWICPTDLAIASKDARRRFMSKDARRNTWWNLNVTSDGRPFLEMVDSARISCAPRPKGVIPENAWTHLAIVVDRANRKIRYYLNARPDSAPSIPEQFAGTLDVAGGDLMIGGTWQPFVGLLDDVRIYKRALAESEIAAIHAAERDRHSSARYEIADE